jgi:hypothetical protein
MYERVKNGGITMIEKLIQAIFTINKEKLDFPMYVKEIEIVFSKENYTLGEIQEQALEEFLEETISLSDNNKPESLEVKEGNIIVKWGCPYPVEIQTNTEARKIAEKRFDEFISNFRIKDIFLEKGEVMFHGFDKFNTKTTLTIQIHSLK